MCLWAHVCVCVCQRGSRQRWRHRETARQISESLRRLEDIYFTLRRHLSHPEMETRTASLQQMPPSQSRIQNQGVLVMEIRAWLMSQSPYQKMNFLLNLLYLDISETEQNPQKCIKLIQLKIQLKISLNHNFQRIHAKK